MQIIFFLEVESPTLMQIELFKGDKMSFKKQFSLGIKANEVKFPKEKKLEIS